MIMHVTLLPLYMLDFREYGEMEVHENINCGILKWVIYLPITCIRFLKFYLFI